MLYQLSYFRVKDLWAKMDSNHRRYKPADLQSAPFGHSGIFPKFSALFVLGINSLRSLLPFRRGFARRLSPKSKISSRFTVGKFVLASELASLNFPLVPRMRFCFCFPASAMRADGGIRTPDQLITNQLLWPTELHRQSLPIRIAKITEIFESAKFWRKFLQLLKEPDFSPLPRTIPWMRMQNRLQR